MIKIVDCFICEETLKKSIFGKSKRIKNIFNINDIDKLYILTHVPSQRIAHVTLHIGKKKHFLYPDAETDLQEFCREIKEKRPDLRIEEDSASVW